MVEKLKNAENLKNKENLGNFNIKINEFGEITSSVNIDNINEYLNKTVNDKKLDNRNDN